jgi:hypothetical protein
MKPTHRGSTTPREKLPAALATLKSNLKAKMSWRKYVNELIRDMRDAIRQDKIDLKHALKHKEYDTAHTLNVVIEENKINLDDLVFLRDNCD